MGAFKDTHPYDKRKEEASRILAKYKDRVPIIVEVSSACPELVLNKKKYLVPSDLTVGQFLYVIRKRIKLTSEQALYIFFNNSLPTTSELIGGIYKKFKDSDDFMYAEISLENTFG
jgi:GABA(A) receptor-associated protein